VIDALERADGVHDVKRAATRPPRSVASQARHHTPAAMRGSGAPVSLAFNLSLKEMVFIPR
jgi:hypothetical protein